MILCGSKCHDLVCTQDFRAQLLSLALGLDRTFACERKVEEEFSFQCRGDLTRKDDEFPGMLLHS